VRWFTRTAGTGSVPSRNQRYAVWGWIPCRRAHSVRFTPQSHHGNVCTVSINHSMASSRQPLRHQGRGSVREHVAQLGRQERHRRRRSHPEGQPRMAEDLQLPVQLPVVGQRPGVVLALVARLPERQVAGAADPGRAADVGPHLEPVDRGAGRGRLQGEGQGGGPLGGPGRLVAPDAGVLVEVGGRVGWRTNTVTGGASSTPLRSPRSHRSHQRTISGTRSIRGPGRELSVAMWLQGPNSSRAGVRSRSRTRKVALR
jgi:hypothetical protein